MEITSLNTKTGATKGAFLHLRHPALKHLMYTGEGADSDGQLIDSETAQKVGVRVLGTESERVRAEAKRLNLARMESDDDDAEQEGLKFVCTLVAEFVGLERGGKPMEATEENKMFFFGQSDSFVEQVINFAKDRGNFFKRG